MPPGRADWGGTLYWLLVGLLAATGAALVWAFLVEGFPLLMLAFTLALLGPFRSKRQMFWPVLAAAGLFVIAAYLVAPHGCTGSVVPAGTPAEERLTTCTSPLGIRYTGSGSFTPSLRPAVVAGVGAGTAGAAAAWLLTRRR